MSSPEELSKTAQATDDAIPSDDSVDQHDLPNETDQRGVQDVEAVTLSWSRLSLILVFLNIFLLYFVNAMQSTILGNLLPYATSAWDTHSLLNVIYVVADAMSAAIYVPLSKILDVWGRAEGFALMTVFATLGLILMAASENLATFCAAYVFYTIGFGGMTFCVDVVTADASKLKNRGLAYAFTSSPYIITAFAGSAASESFYYQISWRWGFGVFAIVFPIVAAPLFFILKANIKKAKKLGNYVEHNSGRTIFESIWHYTVDFDILGVVLFSVGLVLFLLPFDIADSAPDGWASGYIIAMLVVGFCLLLSFAAFEKWVAPVPLLSYHFLTDRTVLGACLLDATYQIAYYCWDNYFTSYLQVVNDVSLAEAGYINNTFNVVSGVLLFGVGYLMRRTGRFRWLLYIAVPLYIFAQGLMIYFRRPNQSVGYQIMCQVFIAIGGSIFIIVQQVAVLAAVDHQHVAAALALLYVIGTIGDALGATISGAIWTNTFPNALEWYLPESAMANFTMIYEDLDTQLSYPVGSETRLAIQDAYGYAQTRMLAAGTGIMALCFIWVFLIRDLNLNKLTQVKGMVF
ncbi:putative MFS siderophore iron transporter [Cryphonectria parasitica EP155]|uniref:MFS siderophore iron transporter n=1 Tax=Cryphonectria parasitica (strain ATCC 38755 / EP155) TaxID=660469 RepID=A0A9P4Y2S3_CRYP1|nr:putative MFS siderophore iron transporter [Cryphonectria parasitica EP155]KAF3765443.1 putative MFS siderophore iron transporter [Cryphonectria parasitica EP155]